MACPTCHFPDCSAYLAGAPCQGRAACDACGSQTCAAAALGLPCDAPCWSCGAADAAQGAANGCAVCANTKGLCDAR